MVASKNGVSVSAGQKDHFRSGFGRSVDWFFLFRLDAMSSCDPPPSSEPCEDRGLRGRIFLRCRATPAQLELLSPSVEAMLEPLSLSVETVRRHVRFLESVHNDAGVHAGMALYVDRAVLGAAVDRYERLWLPLVAAQDSLQPPTLYPPVDIAWVWHLHRLAPLRYASYCSERFGRILDPGSSAFRLQSSDAARAQGDAGSVSTRDLWAAMHDCAPFFLDDIASCPAATSGSSLVETIVATSARQRTFLWQVSGPCFSSEGFLAAAITRYDQFLCLMGTHGYRKQFYVPSYDVDLCWHTHMLQSCSVYLEETRRRAGEPVDHDDSVNDRSTGSRLNRAWDDTRRLWSKTFGDKVAPIDASGTCYRGEPPASWYSQQLATATDADDRRVSVHDDLLDRHVCQSLLALLTRGDEDNEQSSVLGKQGGDDDLEVEVPVAIYGRLQRLLSNSAAHEEEAMEKLDYSLLSATHTLPARVSARDVPVHHDSFVNGKGGPVQGRVGVVYLAGLGTMTFICAKSGQVRKRDGRFGQGET